MQGLAINGLIGAQGMFGPATNVGAMVAPAFAATGTQAIGIAAMLGLRPDKLEQPQANGDTATMLDLLAGFRFLEFREHLGIVETSSINPAAPPPLPAGTSFIASDRFETRNYFYGGVLGARAEVWSNMFFARVTGSVGLLGDAIHNLSDVSTSVVVFLGFRLSKRLPTERYPYGLERAEDLAGVLIVVIIFASALLAAFESIRKLIQPQPMSHVWWVAGAALIGALGNEGVAALRIHAASSSATTPDITLNRRDETPDSDDCGNRISVSVYLGSWQGYVFVKSDDCSCGIDGQLAEAVWKTRALCATRLRNCAAGSRRGTSSAGDLCNRARGPIL